MSNIQQGLLIAAIGMGWVFAVIIFLWGLMALMMRITSRKEKIKEPVEIPEESVTPLMPEMQAAENLRRAVAAAVAVELALANSQSDLSKKRERERYGALNPWQIFHRSRQLQQRNSRG